MLAWQKHLPSKIPVSLISFVLETLGQSDPEGDMRCKREKTWKRKSD